MNPVEYIRRDAEGSDADTRRRAAADLLRALSEKYEAQVTQLMGGYVTRLLQVRTIAERLCLLQYEVGLNPDRCARVALPREALVLAFLCC